MMLSQNFSLEEFTRSDLAARHGWNNSPDEFTLERLKSTAKFMDSVRAILGKPILINSAYRSKQVNSAVGGVTTSAHTLGYAVDFRCPEIGTPLEVCRKLDGVIGEFDQMIYEYEAWTHLSFDPRMRREVLTVKADGKGYQPGLVP